MMNIREKVFFVSGDNFLQRQRAIEGIKKRIQKDKFTSLNTLTFYSKEIYLQDLQEKLFTASFNKSKIAVFKDFPDLTSAVRNLLFDNLERILFSNYIIFETDKDYYQLQRNKKFISDKFFSLVFKKAALFKIASSKKKVSIEDFFNSVRKNDLASSLFVLESLFTGAAKDKSLGPQIVGFLVGKFSYLGYSAKKDKYFKHLWEADRAIKEKGFDTRLVIETLLVKLFAKD